MHWQQIISGIDLSWLEPLLSNIEFWRGAGRFVLDLTLVYALVIIVMTVSGHPVAAWPLRHNQKDGRAGGPDTTTVRQSADEGAAHPPRTRSRSTEQHLEFLDRLSTALKYQGSTVVLIVFAVLLLGIQHILGATEIATILSGIAGFVLGQAKMTEGAGSNSAGPRDQVNDASQKESGAPHETAS